MTRRAYAVNDCYATLQGEGALAGTPMVLLRFQGCNLRCALATHGFDCDTEFDTGRFLSLGQVLELVHEIGPRFKWVLLTGGEPLLQTDEALVDALHGAGYSVAVESNGTRLPPKGIDHLTVSPKVSEADLAPIPRVQELRYVRGPSQPIPIPRLTADHYFLSPAFLGNTLDPEAVAHCIQLVKDNPQWRLSIQAHKILGMR